MPHTVSTTPARRHWGRRVATILVFALALLVAVPPGAVPPAGAGSGFPISWLWSWLPARPGWSAPGPDGPQQRSAGGADGKDHYAPTAQTTANGGSGQAPGRVPGANDPATSSPPTVAKTTTPSIVPKGFDTAKSRRLADRAESNADVFQNPDGSITRKLHESPINFRTTDGSLAPIDRTLTKSGKQWKQKASAVDARFAATADDPRLVTLAIDAKRSVSYGLAGAAPVSAEASDSSALYRGVLPETDLRLTMGPNGIKEDLILHSPDATNSWVFPLDLKGLTAAVEPDGSVALRDYAGTVAAHIPVGYMRDSYIAPGSGAFTTSSAITYALSTVHGKPALVMTADAAWLRDPARKFPVTVDPNLGYNTTGDTYVQYGDDGNNAAEDNLAVGTWDSGAHRSISLLQFTNYGNAFNGKNLSAVKLKLFLTWQFNCTAQPFQVRPVTQSWSPSSARYGTVSYSGPTLGASIGTASPNSSRACNNQEADRSVGEWVTVNLPVATFQAWANGGTNYGLGLFSSQTVNAEFKRFTSRDGPNPVFTPYLEMTYTGNQTPQVNAQHPAHGDSVATLTPELLVTAKDPDAFPNALTYNFLLYDRTATKIAESGYVASRTWQVPAGKLKWGETYTWTVIASDGNLASTSQKLNSFSTYVPQKLLTSNLAQNDEKGFDHSAGNYTMSATDASVPTVGPPLSIARSYNSLDTNSWSAFGRGWASVLDMRVVDPWLAVNTSGPTRNVRYPNGREVTFGINPDGTFSGPPGRFSTLRKIGSGNMELVDKDGTTYNFRLGYSFPGQFDLVSITDGNGRTLTFEYTCDFVICHPATITSSSGRKLYLTWKLGTQGVRDHVTSVRTEPVVPSDPSSALTWTYTYDGHDLTKVCPPTSTTKCTTYSYVDRNIYATAVADTGPRAYWRLGESSGTAATNSVVEAAGAEAGTYTNVTLGQPGPLPGSSATAGTFNGTSSYVSLPVKDIDPAGQKSVSLWFKMTANSTAGGTLFAYQTNPITSAPTPDWTPVLYVGVDGFLRGEFWHGAVAPAISTSKVNDGVWHHAVITANRTTQTLYVDGFPQATTNRALVPLSKPANYVYIGAGETNTWPSRPTNSKGFFPGSIAEVALYDRELSRFDVDDLDNANLSRKVVSGVVQPSGKVQATVGYNANTGRVDQVTDENGGVWKIGGASAFGSYRVHSGVVLGANPADYYRFAESGTTEPVNEVNGGVARYNVVSLGTPGGPFDDPARSDDDTTVATFNGDSSFVEMPANDVPGVGPQTIALWFKTPTNLTSGGVLYGSQVNPVDGDQSQLGGWTPNLYVGTDGKLRGKFWNGSDAVMTSTALVNDGKWHHVMLAASTTTQSLYLDGAPVGTINGTLTSFGATKAYVGAGQSLNWAARPTNPRGYFSGDIAEVSYYRAQLSAAHAAAQFGARSKSSGVPAKSYTVTDPTNKPLTYLHDLADRQIQETNALGHTTRYGYDVNGYLRTTTDPNNNVTTTEHDPRGNVLSSTTCQDRSANRCSTVYYSYFANSTPAAMWAQASLFLSPGDFDGDGAADVMFRNADNNLYLMRGSDEGGWLTSVPARLGTNFGSIDQMFSPGDFDGDGHPDLIWHQPGSNDFGLWRGNGKGAWISGASTALTSTFGATAQMVFSPGDFDGDGKSDVIFRKSTDNNLYLVKGNGAGGWQTGTPVLLSTGWAQSELIFSPGDFNGDGFKDVVYRKTTDKNLYLVKGNGTGGFLAGAHVQIDTGWSDADVLFSPGDFSGDNKPDVIHRKSGNKELYLDRGNGTGGWVTGTSELLGNGGPDPRNDAMLTMRDGRSASAADNRFLTTLGYDSFGNQTTATDPLGRVTTSTYTDGATPAEGGGVAPSGLPATVTSPGGARQAVTYYPNGDVARTTDAAGKVTTFTYDGVGRVSTRTETTESFPQGLTTTFEYDKLGRLTTQTDPPVTNRVTGATHTARTVTVFDDDGRPLSETVSDLTGGDAPRTESATYNGYGQQDSATDDAGKTTRLEYDAYGRPVKEIGADGQETLTGYDAAGQHLTTTLVGWTGDPDNPSPARDLVLESKEYDPAGRLASETDAMGWQTLYTYTDNALVVTVTRKDPSTGATFLLRKTDYDGAGNELTVTANDNATKTTNTYDAASRVTQSSADPDGERRDTIVTYSPDDHVIATDERTPATLFTRKQASYDPMGRLLSETRYLSNNAPAARWRFDESAGTAATDAAGNSPLSATGPVSWNAGSVVLSGATTLRGKSPIVDTAGGYTVAARVTPADGAGYGVIVSAGGVAQDAFSLRASAGFYKFAIRSADSPDATTVEAISTTAATNGVPAHVAGVFDPETKTAKLYVNGVLEDTKTVNTSFSARQPVRVGARLEQAGLWRGGIDDIQLYQRVVPATEIAQINTGALPTADAAVSRVTYDLDDGGLVRSVTDPNGNTTDYENDAAGRTVVTVAPAISTETAGTSPATTRPVSFTGYDTFGGVVENKDPNGNVTVNEYDAAGRVSAIKAPAYTAPGTSTVLRPVIARTYTNLGQLETETDPRGKLTRYAYDRLGRLTKVTDAGGGVSKRTYSLNGDLLSSTDPTGARTEATYDHLGRMVTATDVVRQTASSHTTRYDYGFGGWLASTTTPDGVVTKSTYNAHGNQITKTDGANNVTTSRYDGVGRLDRTTNADGTYTNQAWDQGGRMHSQASYDEAGVQLRKASRAFDKAGRVVSTTDPRGNATTFGFDAAGLLRTQIEPISASDSITTTFGYDPSGNQTRFTDGRGDAFLTTYNTWGLPESRIEPATASTPAAADRTFTQAYDVAARAVGLTAPGGVAVTNEYNDIGKLTHQVGAGAEAQTPDRVFDYDLAGRLKSASGVGGANTFTFDDRGLLLSTSGPSGSSSFTWSAGRKLTSRNDAAGATTYGYDSAGRPDSVANPTTGVGATYTYSVLNQVKTIAYGTGGNVRTLNYDKLGQLTGDELRTAGGQSVASIGYGYDANGNETSKTTTGFAGSTSNVYTYDFANRLTSWDNGTNPVVYAYDKSGNRVQAGGVTFAYDQRNQLTSASNGTTYAYTKRGTLASMTSAAGTVTTATDAFGQVRSQGAANGTTQSYDYDAFGRLIRAGFAYSGVGNTLAADGAAVYTRGVASDVIGVQAGAEKRLAWTDRHTDQVAQFGATSGLLSGSTAYDPLGQRLAVAGMLGNLGYQSEWTDSGTGRVNMLARWYNPATGQFDTRDTATMPASPTSVTANRFAYADNNPLTVTDPTGHGPDWLKPLRALGSGIKSGASWVWNGLKSAWNGAMKGASAAWDWTKKKWNDTKKAVNDAIDWAGDKIEEGRRNIVKGYEEVKRKAERLAANVKQAGQNMVAKAMSNKYVARAVNNVADAYKATEKWVQDHKAEIVGFIAGTAVGLGCGALIGWTGVGAVACGAAAGAVGSLVTGAMKGERGWDLVKTTALGGLAGAFGGFGGVLGGKLTSSLAGKLTSGVSGKLSSFAGGFTSRVVGGAAGGGLGDAMGQFATTGKVDLRQVAVSTLLGGVSGGMSRNPCHSFAPQTRVLMADGTKRPIADVNIGDKVVATDPKTGKTAAKPVTALHLNRDRELADVKVKTPGARTTTLKTTQNHPFWDKSARRWVAAGALAVGAMLASVGAATPAVAEVRNHVGAENMRDLTVADIHTYYVVAGDTSVLVHNNNAAACDIPALKDMARDIRTSGQSQPAIDRKVVAVGQDAAGNLSVGASNPLDPGQLARAAELDIRVVPKVKGLHAEEELMYDKRPSLFGTPSPLKRVASDNQGACGPDRHDCAGQMDALGIEHN